MYKTLFSNHSPDLLYLNIIWIFDLIIINCYVPTKDKNEDIKDNFYEDLKAVNNSLLLHYVNMIVGNQNAKVRKESSFRLTIGGPDNL